MNIALIVFAGKGTRVKSPIPKQFIKIHDKELVIYTIEQFQKNQNIDEIVLVTHPDYIDLVKKLVKQYELSKVKNILPGGETRQDSVRLGLLSMEYDEKDNVLIHDGDRPLVSQEIIDSNINQLNEFSAVCTMIYHRNALKEVSNLGRNKKINDIDADIQTPQSFKFGLIKKYHLLRQNEEFSDDASIVERDIEVCYIPGNKYNFKITTDGDLEHFKNLIEQNEKNN
ncbi:MAG: 2-C-methyl-D-erythritol 4-phosphate cytidylyltransferase [Bacilli bacterium]|nr:2-C-methyl-D-erythritol 4-phosphate cytidylyltransferase [Bacilli bacterium]